MSPFSVVLPNRHHVSVNLLTATRLYTMEIQGQVVIVMQVPRATRYERPVFIGLNPLSGPYRRDRTGDYKCSPEAVRRMLADQLETPPDSQILPFLRREHLDPVSIQQYRNRFASRDPDHTWLALGPDEFLERLGAWRRDLRTEEEGITVAGILMFGKHEFIARPEVLPDYHVDYREPSDKPSERWADRLWPDGKWVANLYQFFYETLFRLYRGLKVPFQLRDSARIDETPAHIAIREALVNALIHADYSGKGGVVITKNRERITLENPGTLLVSYDQLQRGGFSECRNKSLQVMFSMLGMSEKAGSRMDKIREGSLYLHSLPFAIRELTDSSRINVVFPYASMLPAESVAHLEALYKVGLDTLDPDERLALVIAEDEREVSNLRLQLASEKHPADLTKLLRGLVQKGFLTADKNTRPRIYPLSRLYSGNQTPQLDLLESETDNGALVTATPPLDGGTPPEGLLTEVAIAQLRQRAFPEGTSAKPRSENEVKEAILRVCAGRFLNSQQLSLILQRSREKLRERYLTPMAKSGLLIRRYPDQPSRKDQAYQTAMPDRKNV